MSKFCKKRIAVLGLGSSGVQSLCHLLSWVGAEYQVVSIHSPKIPILGIGESTNPAFVSSLQRGIDFSISSTKHMRALNATYKLGTKYKNWRTHEFINPLIEGGLAIHMDTFKLKEFALPRLKNRWGERFSCIEGEVSNVENNKREAIVYLEDRTEIFDYVVDCRGVPDTENGTFINPSTLLDSCIVYDYINKTSNSEKILFTGHIATKNGWMFAVPLQSRTSYGYLFNSDITTEEHALEDMNNILGLGIKDYRMYSFNPYINTKIINNRVIDCGNRAAFFEPMFANSLWLYSNINRLTIDYLLSGESEDYLNQKFTQSAISVLEVIALHYLKGSTFNTEFGSTLKYGLMKYWVTLKVSSRT